MRNLIIGLLCLTFFTSCLSTKVKVNTPYKAGLPIDTLNLASTMIGPLWQPVFPLIDAAAFNGKTNKIADDIMNEEQKIIADYKFILLDKLKDLPNTEVKTGNDLRSESLNNLFADKTVQIDNNNFPVVFFSDNDYNLADFGNGKNVNKIFKENEELKTNIARIAAEQHLKNVLISYNRLAVINVGAFGGTGNLRLETYLFLYRANGELLLDAYGWTKPVAIGGKDISRYVNQLEKFDEISTLMMDEFAKYIN